MRPTFLQDVKKRKKNIQVVRIVKDVMAKKRLLPRYKNEKKLMSTSLMWVKCIQKAFKVCKVFKVKSLKPPKLDVPSKKAASNLFCKDIQKTKKDLQGVLVCKASAII